ncbi:MAG TPA: DUF4956 domain-containing protein [Sedimentisphaerales bacterium]|jgi:hypothetical protein|nr:DUF4956 domain-containing protein [Sedimentisphaerales bacterium]HNU30625.1 DUF4956 domain-containing protein [Sedimentisphaerales bacterium]
MDRWWQLIEDTAMTGTSFGPQTILLSLLLAFVLGQVIAWVYYITHSGLSYSRSYVQSLILITVVVAMVMAVIGNNIITAVGLMGALAIVRFRNVVKDTRDIVFIFSALVVGMACGSHRYLTAILGTAVLSLIAVYLFFTDFGSHEPHNGFLRFSLRGPIGPDHPVPGIMRRFCGNFIMISAQDSGFGGPAEYAYQIMIRNVSRNEEFVSELEKVDGMENISLTMQEKLLEV